ncbi:MAG: PAS domain-containing sensor histidine kinase [Flavobacteriaceae bacterium]|nr:PAS domain-containing sensor histidine kinase [Flavobacteriaceae bacterium]
MRKYSLQKQFLFSIVLIVSISITLYYTVDYLHYRTVALILLLCVSVSAMLFDIYPVLVTAFLSAFIWNFFFIPPTFTLHIGSPEDALMFLMYFVIALINAVLSFKIREYQVVERDRIEKENSIKLYNSLLNSLSHEMRTPIATIIGSVDVLNENEQNISPIGKKELLQEIEKAGLRLNRQVDNILNMSRLESGILQPQLDWCDIGEITHLAIKHNHEHQKNHDIQVIIQPELPYFKLDRFLIEHILINLIHNALVYTPDHTQIKVEVQYHKKVLKLIISDNGNGIPEKNIAQVFDKFYRLPNAAAGGTGLGLSIVKGFTEAHQGSINLENIKTGGAKFTVSLPVETSEII